MAVLLDLADGQKRELPRAVAALSHDASFALSLSFERLADVRPETGYPGVTDPYRGVDAPEQDGIHRIDLDSGAVELIMSLAQIAALEPRSEMTGGPSWVNHLTLSPDDAQIVFVHRWWPAGAARFQTRLCAAGADGRGLRVIWPGHRVTLCLAKPTRAALLRQLSGASVGRRPSLLPDECDDRRRA